MDEVKPPSIAPYIVSWYENGEKKTMRRVPPPRLHQMLPTDIVELKSKRSDDFKAGEEFEIKHIANRHPNTIQLVNSRGETTFVGFHHLELKEEVAERPGRLRGYVENSRKNAYIPWP